MRVGHAGRMLELSPAQRVEAALMRSLLNLPPVLRRRLTGPPVSRRGQVLDPQVHVVLTLNRLMGNKNADEVGPERARVQTDVSAAQVTHAPARVASVEERKLAGRPVRIYRPEGERRPGPALLYIHGGGFVVGGIDSHDTPCRELAARARCTVVSVDYRLAPEHLFPAAADDCLATFRAMVAEADALGLDRRRLAIGGDSAGGNLSAVLALDTRNDEVRPCFQLLIYPAVDMTMSSPSIDELGQGFFLEKQTIAWYRDRYLGDNDQKHPRASPLFVEDLSGLPPALVVTAGFDPLWDEGQAYAERLREAGVEVAHHHHAGMFHGFWNCTNVIREAERAFDEAVGVTRAALGG